MEPPINSNTPTPGPVTTSSTTLITTLTPTTTSTTTPTTTAGTSFEGFGDARPELKAGVASGVAPDGGFNVSATVEWIKQNCDFDCKLKMLMEDLSGQISAFYYQNQALIIFGVILICILLLLMFGCCLRRCCKKKKDEDSSGCCQSQCCKFQCCRSSRCCAAVGCCLGTLWAFLTSCCEFLTSSCQRSNEGQVRVDRFGTGNPIIRGDPYSRTGDQKVIISAPIVPNYTLPAANSFQMNPPQSMNIPIKVEKGLSNANFKGSLKS